MIASDSPQNSSFPFSCRMVASQNPPRHESDPQTQLALNNIPDATHASIKIVPLIIKFVMTHYYGEVLV